MLSVTRQRVPDATQTAAPPSQRLPPWPDLAPLQPLFDAAQIVGLFEWDITADVIFPCLGMVRIFGLDSATIRAGAPAAVFAPALHPEDRGAFPGQRGSGACDTEQRIYRVVGQDGMSRTILQSLRFARGPHGPADWACGVMFDYPLASPARVPHVGLHVLGALDRAARLAIELRQVVEEVGSPVLRTLVDMVLVEIGEALARQLERSETVRLN